MLFQSGENIFISLSHTNFKSVWDKGENFFTLISTPSDNRLNLQEYTHVSLLPTQTPGDILYSAFFVKLLWFILIFFNNKTKLQGYNFMINLNEYVLNI